MSPPGSAPPDRWSLESWFTAFGAPDYLAFKDGLTRSLAAQSESSAEGSLAAALAAYEDLSVKLGHLSAYLGCLSADDAGNESVKAEEAWLSGREADWSKIEAGLRSRLAALSAGEFAALAADPALADARLPARPYAGGRSPPDAP